jgi:hypothetical protein
MLDEYRHEFSFQFKSSFFLEKRDAKGRDIGPSKIIST